MAEEIVFETKVKTDKAEGELNKVKGGVKDTDAATKGLTNQLDKMTGGAISGFKGLVGGVKSGIGAMKSLRVAIAATGLGLLVVALGSLVTAFQRNQEVADKVNRVFAQIGAVTDILLDNFSNLGVAIIDAFENPQQAVSDLWEAIKTNILNRLEGFINTFKAAGRAIQAVLNLDWDAATEAAGDFGTALVQATTGFDQEQQESIYNNLVQTKDALDAAKKAADELEGRQQALRDANIQAIRTDAELRASIEAKRLAAEEEGLSIQRQIELFEEADAIEQQLLASRKSRAKEEADILRGKQELSINTAKDDRELAQLEAELINLEAQSAAQRLRLNRRLTGLRRQRANEEKQLNQELQKLRLDNLEDEREKLEAEQRIALEAIREKYGQGTELEKQLLIKQQNELRELEQAERERELEEERLELENELLRTTEDSERRFELQRMLAEKERQIQLENDQLTAAQRERIQLDYLAKLEKIKDAEIQISDATTDAEKQNTTETIQSVNQAVSAVADAVGLGKEISVASAVVDTYVGANKAIAQGGVAGIAAAASVIAAGLANVKKIISTDVPEASGGGGGGAPSGGGGGGVSITPSQLTDDVQGQNQRFAAFQSAAANGNDAPPTRAFVLEGDVTSSQSTVKRINRKSKL